MDTACLFLKNSKQELIKETKQDKIVHIDELTVAKSPRSTGDTGKLCILCSRHYNGCEMDILELSTPLIFALR